jgi:hypothetical protein
MRSAGKPFSVTPPYFDEVSAVGGTLAAGPFPLKYRLALES